MINFNLDSVIVSPEIGDTISFNVSMNGKGERIYLVNYSQFLKSPISIQVKNDWLSWHNYGARLGGFDPETLIEFGEDIKLNRWFMYAPYSGVSISTWVNKDMRFNLKLLADDKSQFDACLADFEAYNNSVSKFSLYRSGSTVFGPYLIYKV